MARIRSIKPEAFRSRTIKKLSFPARWTFQGLVIHADDKGRLKDDIDLIRADVYPLELDEVSIKDVESHIQEMVDVEMLCRYQVNGTWYLHFINFGSHQKINRPSQFALPACPYHEDDGSPKPGARPSGPKNTEPSGTPHVPLSESAVSPQPSRARTGSGREVDKEVEGEKECAPLASVTTLPPPAPEPVLLVPAVEPAALFELAPPAPGPQSALEIVEPEKNAGTLIAEWIDFRTRKDPDNKPPKRTVGQVSKELKLLLDEVSYEVVRQGFMEWDAKGAGPSALASFVNQVQSRRAQDAVTIPAQRPSATTLRTQTGLGLMREFAAEEGVDLSTLLPSNVIPLRREITA